jgi:tetraacyldisaccharide 4'-kinase
MITFIYSLMTDRRKGLLFAPFKFILFILSLAYGVAIFARGMLYKARIFKSHKVPLRIVSVGNLTLGGTGKTPFVITLSRILKDELKKEAAVLIRGYGWDEQAMLKKSLPDIPILVGENRVKSAGRAIKLYGTTAAVLDDGFQYWELERDLDIVLVDSRNPFGNNRLFPRGVLREPLSATQRADVIVFTKVNKKHCNLAALQADMKKHNASLVFIETYHKPKHLYDTRARKELALTALTGRRVVLLSSIGDGAYFEETVKDLGAIVVEHIAFGDHHNYTHADRQRILKRCQERSFDLLITTEKDMVKLTRMCLYFEDYNLMVLAVEMHISSGRELLIDRLRLLYNRQGA